MSWLRSITRRPLSLSRPLCLVTLAVVAASCAPGAGGLGGGRRHFVLPSGHPPPDAQAETEAESLLAQWRQARAHEDHDAQQTLTHKIFKSFPATEAAAIIHEHNAHDALTKSLLPEAVAEFEAVLFHRPQYPHIARIRAEYAVLLVRTSRAEDGLALWRTLPNTSAEDGRAHVGEALLKPLVDAGLGRQALELMALLPSLTGFSTARLDDLQQWGRDVAANLVSANDLEGLWKTHQRDPAWAPLSPTIGLRLAKVRYHTGDHNEAERIVRDLKAMPVDETMRPNIERFAEMIHSRFEVSSKTIGVLLPLSGRFGQFGERSLAAIRLALAAFPDIELVVKDTAGEPHAASQAIDSLIFEHHAIAAIGPLFSNEAAAAALKAEELGLPLLSLSHREGLSDLGRYVFRSALTVALQAQTLARVAMEDLGLSRFALLFPKSRYGVDFAQAFWDEVERRHGEIRGVESYDPQQTTFREPVRRLIGRWYLNARPEFHTALEALKERNLPSLKMRSEVERLDKKTTPIIDFEAIVVPDSGRQLGLVAPAIAFEDVLLSHDPKTLDKVRRALNQPELQPITLLGGSTWNNSQTLESCEQYCEDGIFVDAFFGGSTDTRVRDFVSGFGQAQGSEPLLSEAQAYDSAAFVASVIHRKAPRERSIMREALLDHRDFVGVCGPMFFDEHGEAQKTLQTLSIQGHTIVPLARRSKTGRRS